MVVSHLSELVPTPDVVTRLIPTPRSLSGTCARESVDYPLSQVVRKWHVGQR